MKSFKDGLILLNKPPGYTSFEILKGIKAKLGSNKVGHTGTLDKFAEGLLVVLTGRLTRLASFLLSMDKEYLARVRFGKETDSLDPEGSVIDTGEIPSPRSVRLALEKFKGEIEQVPPAFSAVHYKGERAYKLARRGETPELSPRKVTIEIVQVLSYVPPDLSLRIACSKGTYMRSLARDLGREAGTCAYLTSLTRTRVGEFELSDAVSPENFEPASHVHRPSVFLKSLPGLQPKVVRTDSIVGILNGVPVRDSSFSSPPQGDGLFALFTGSEDLVAIVEKREGTYSYRAVFAERV